MKIRPWARLLIAAAALLLAASWGVSGALQHGWARRPLLAALSADFGRPVDVGSFSFGLFGGPRLEADSVTVAEDPRFGGEYFLRADQLDVGLRWSALLRGRVEFGAVSLSNPSLNLVRAADGHWNVESWLPPRPPAAAFIPAAAAGSGAAVAPVPATRHLGRIVVDSGRINFKLGTEKLLFALVEVSGHLDQDAAGRWSLDLEANPMRASVALQEAGTLRLRGTVAGTSARLRPARLELTWDDVSLADALRLARGQDYGVRGAVSAQLLAQIKDGIPADGTPDQSNDRGNDQWNIAATVNVSGIHRWDLPARPADPAVSVALGAAWRPGAPDFQIARCTVQSAQSRLDATAGVNWSRGFAPNLQIVDSHIDLADVLAWSRSFWPSLPEALGADGVFAVRGSLAGWPMRVQQASLSAPAAELRSIGSSDSAREPIRFGPFSASLRRDALVLAPVVVTLPGEQVVAKTGARGAPETGPPGPPAGTLLVSGALGPFLSGASARDWPYRVAISGQTTRAEDLLAVAQSFGRRPSLDWKVEGPVGMQLAWSGVLLPPKSALSGTAAAGAAQPTGTIDLRGLRVSSAILNRPLLLSSVSIELRPEGRRVRIAQAEAFGAHWKGALDWRGPERVWHFDLAADRLDAADLDRWLGPRARPSFLERVLPFAVSASPALPLPRDRDAAIAHLAAYGRLRVGEVALDPLRIERLDASVDITGRSLALRRVQAAFFDGRLTGDLEARLSSEPSYSFRGQFDRVNLAALADAAPSLDGRFAGLAAGELLLSARGVGKPRLLATLTGQGDLRVRDAMLRGFDLAPVTAGAQSAAGDLSRIPAERLARDRVAERGAERVAERVAGERFAAAGAGAGAGAGERPGGDSRFTSGVASFHLAGGSIHVDDLSLAGREGRFEIQGDVNPSLPLELDLHVRAVPRSAAAVETVSDFELAPDAAASADEWAIGGTLDAPVLTRQTRLASDSPAARSARR